MVNTQDSHGALLLCNTTMVSRDPRNRAPLPQSFIYTEARGGQSPNCNLFPVNAQNVILNKNMWKVRISALPTSLLELLET